MVRLRNSFSAPASRSKGKNAGIILFPFFAFLSLFPFAETAAQEVFTEIFPVKKEVYLGEEFEIRLRIWDALGLAELVFMPSDWKNIDVFPDPKTDERIIKRNGKPYQVTQVRLRSVIKTAGRQTFPSLCMVANVPEKIIAGHVDLGREFSKKSENAYNNVVFSLERKELTVCSEPFSVNVLNLPERNPPLFPATAVKLSSGIAPRSKSVEAGTPVKRTVVLTAQGTLAGYLPDVAGGEPEGVRTYPARLEHSQSASGKRLTAGLRRTVVYIPERAGELVLPEIRVDWLNTATGNMETSTLPSEKISVLPASATGKSRTASFESGKKADAVAEFETAVKEKLSHLKRLFPEKGGLAFVLVFAFFAGMVFRAVKPAAARMMLRRRAVSDVKKACAGNDCKRMEKALIFWAQTECGDRRILNLADIGASIAGGNADVGAVLGKLSRRLYEDGEIDVSGAEVFSVFCKCRSSIRKRKKEKDVFPDLYPD